MVVSRVHFCGEFLKRAERASCHADALAVDFDGLQIHPLAAAGGDVRVATGVAVFCGFSAELTDAGHRKVSSS